MMYKGFNNIGYFVYIVNNHNDKGKKKKKIKKKMWEKEELRGNRMLIGNRSHTFYVF